MKPEWDIAHDSIAMNAITHDRDNADVIQRQKDLREETKINGKRNQKRIEKIRKMQADLRLKFIESNDFMRQCSEKETKAIEKINEETDTQRVLQQEIDELEMKIENLKKFHEKFRAAIEELKPYEEVLDQVVENMELFQTKDDFLDRCDTLRKYLSVL